MSKKILLADDSVTIQKVVSITLAHEDFELIIVDNGTEAISRAKEIRPDVILLDVVMPGKDGFAVCKELKENPHYHFFSEIPVLLLTIFPRGVGETNIPLWAGVTTEAEGYVQKPVSPEDLLKQAEELLKKYG